MGKLIIKNDLRLFDWRKIIKRGTCHVDNNKAQYTLPYHKADATYKGLDIILLSQDIADPVSLLQLYLSCCDARHGTHPALFITAAGTHPSRNWFNGRFFCLLGKEYGGQPCCSGGITFYASLGLDEDILMGLGRWSSQAWKLYLRDHPAAQAKIQLNHLCR